MCLTCEIRSRVLRSMKMALPPVNFDPNEIVME